MLAHADSLWWRTRGGTAQEKQRSAKEEVEGPHLWFPRCGINAEDKKAWTYEGKEATANTPVAQSGSRLEGGKVLVCGRPASAAFRV